MTDKVKDLPLAAIIFTDINRDGMLKGTNVHAIETLEKRTHIPVIASGGVGSLKDIEDLKHLPIEGLIVGRALYEDKFTLTEAIAAAK